MDMKVIGKHALFFDDDQMASFVNSIDALVIWNSIPIDRYDVRHLLTTPPSSRRSFPRHGSSSPPLSDSSLQSDLDNQRFMDLPTHGDPDLQCDDDDNPLKVEDNYHKVGFSYATSDPPSMVTGFRPPFPLPPTLLGHTPDSEQTHQIIARTAQFVQKQGVQSEFVLRVKQGDNPKFGFLTPGHHLHPYFRHLVDNRALLAASPAVNPRADAGSVSGSISAVNPSAEVGYVSGLSLLGSVYGSLEDEKHGSGSSTSAVDVEGAKPDGKLQFRSAGKEKPVDLFYPPEVNGSSYSTALKTDNCVREMKKAKKNSRRLDESKKKKPQEEKVRTVIGESNRADFGVSVDATAAAAILQAATRGIRNPSLSISLSGGWIDPTAGIRSEPDMDGLTKEQKLKAERLKKAKMFLLGLNCSGPASAPSQDGTLRDGTVRDGTRAKEEERKERRKRRGEELEEGEIGFNDRCRKNGGRRNRFVKLSEDVR